MIRFRGNPISDADAGELARWIRAVTNETVTADRLDRVIDAGQGLLGADRGQAAAVIAAISAIEDDDPALAERLAAVRADLEEYAAQPPARHAPPSVGASGSA